MDTTLGQVMSPGQCVQLDEAGRSVISSCVGFYSQSGDAPAWFSAFYQWTVGSRMTYERSITDRDRLLGIAERGKCLLEILDHRTANESRRSQCFAKHINEFLLKLNVQSNQIQKGNAICSLRNVHLVASTIFSM